MDCSLPGSSVQEDSPSKNTGGGCHAILQRIFSTQGSKSNPGLPQCRQILSCLMFFHKRKKKKGRRKVQNYLVGIWRAIALLIFPVLKNDHKTLSNYFFKFWGLLQLKIVLASSGSQDSDWSQLSCFDSVAPRIIPNVHHHRTMKGHNYWGGGCYFSFCTCFDIILGIIWCMK